MPIALLLEGILHLPTAALVGLVVPSMAQSEDPGWLLERGLPAEPARSGTEPPATSLPTGCNGESANSCSFSKLHLTFN